MNQQEIDRLWEKHSKPNNDFEPVWVVSEADFTAAIQEATAQARREALDAVEKATKIAGNTFNHEFTRDGYVIGSVDAMEAIRALAAQEQEGKI